MNIAITGTKGIPNRYGGFEQLAEFLATGLVARGHKVTVYNPSFHPYKNNDYKGVRIISKSSSEKFIGPAANLFYDYRCIRDAIKNKPDIILECGYDSIYSPNIGLLIGDFLSNSGSSSASFLIFLNVFII